MLLLAVSGQNGRILAQGTPGVSTPPASVIGWWFFEFAPAGLSLLLKISSDGKNGYRATEDNLVIVGKRDHPESPFWCDGRNVRTEINRGADGIVQVKLNDKGDKLEGFYKNGDVTIPMAYLRVQPTDFPPEPLLDFTNTPTGTKDIRGYWKGTLTRDGGRFDYAFKIGHAPNAPNGTFGGSFDLFQAGRLNQRLTHATLTNNEVRIGNRDLGLRFEGTFGAEGETMKGRISDWAESGEIVFSRLASPAQPPTLRLVEDPGALGPIAGSWDALVDRQRSDTRTRIRIGHDSAGSVLALVNNPEEEDPILVASTSATVQEKAIHLTWKGRGQEFQGELRGNQLEGSWLEGKSRTPIVFHRVQPGE